MKEKINILLANNSPFSTTKGGLERTTVNLAKELSKLDELRLFTFFNSYDEEVHEIVQLTGVILSVEDFRSIIIENKIDIIIFPAGPWYSIIGKQATIGLNCKIITCYHSTPGYELMFERNKRIDAIYQSNNFVQITKEIAKLILYFFNKNKFISDMIVRFQSGYEKSDSFVLLSNNYFNDFCETYKIKDGAKLESIPNPVPFNEFATKELIVNKHKRILVVSRLIEHNKKILKILNAWNVLSKKHLDWELDIVGWGKDEKKYKKYCIAHNIKRVYFHGKQSPEEFYKKSRIFLMASIWEGLPMTILEAMQNGCIPVVYNNFKTAPELIDNGINGFYVEKNDDINFINIINNLMLDNNFHLIASKSVEKSRNYSPELILHKWQKLILDLKVK
jgi:glycosyltransferase involved in cell wall biosynthesis